MKRFVNWFVVATLVLAGAGIAVAAVPDWRDRTTREEPFAPAARGASPLEARNLTDRGRFGPE